MMKYILGLIFLFFLSSCSLAPDGEVLYLKSNTSYHPVYVRGNPNADTYLIWVHGGPGSSSLYYGNLREVNQLHEKYRVVYWDQLGSGGTVGNPSPSDYTIEEFSSAVQGIVNLVKKRYNPKNIYLMGHSWGGMLSAYYLIGGKNAQLAEKRQSVLNGFIGINPVFDMQDTIQEGISFITQYANEQIAKNNKIIYWQEALNWYQSINGTMNGADLAKHFAYVLEAGGIIVDINRYNEIIKEQTPKVLLTSPFEFFSYLDNQKGVRTYLRVENCSLVRENEINLSSINIPTIIFAGEKDRVIFPNDLVNWFSLITNGKPPAVAASSSLVMFTNSAHSVFIDENSKFISNVDQFIRKNNR